MSISQDKKTWWMLEHYPPGLGQRFTPWCKALVEVFQILPTHTAVKKVWVKHPDEGVKCIAETEEDLQRLFG